DLVPVELAIADGAVDARQVLRDDTPCAEAQVADLGVPDHARRQPDRLAGRRQQTRGKFAGEPLHEARAARRDGIPFGGVAVTPAVEDDEERGESGGAHSTRLALPRIGGVDGGGADPEFLDRTLLLEVDHDAVPLSAALAVVHPGRVLAGAGSADVFNF